MEWKANLVMWLLKVSLMAVDGVKKMIAKTISGLENSKTACGEREKKNQLNFDKALDKVTQKFTNITIKNSSQRDLISKKVKELQTKL